MQVGVLKSSAFEAAIESVIAMLRQSLSMRAH